MPRPVYQAPEAPGKMRTAIGIGLSGMAGLSGQSQYAAQNFFLAPEARAERDYARELGEYSASQGEWSDYYDDVMQREELDLSRQQLEELKNRPRSFSRGGGLVSREGEELYRDPGGMFGSGGAQWEAEKMQAYRVWLEKPENAHKTLASMTETDRQAAERDLNRYFGREVLSSVWDTDRPGVITGEYRSESQGRPRPVTVYGPGGVPQTGGAGGFQTQPPRAPRQRGFSDSERANMEIDYEQERVEAVSFDEETRQAVEKKYDSIFVRGISHVEGEKMTIERAMEYIRIARAELGDAALNMSVERLAKAWAEQDGYDTTP